MAIHPKQVSKSNTLYSEVLSQGSGSEYNISIEASEQFTNTTHTRALSDRALTYLKVGYPVHLTGPAGIGKTTIALHIAAKLGNPVILIHGNDEFTSSDLIGKDTGYHRSQIVDNFVHSVIKTREEMTASWMDNYLTTACEQGCTLVYDEFNRSRAETNNVFLSVLSEGILSLPRRRQKEKANYIEVHPNFRIIFTSNSEEYVGVHKTQNALADRFITINVDYPDKESEIEIVQKRSGLSVRDTELIVELARVMRREGKYRPSIRACIAIARVLVHLKRPAHVDDPIFQAICRDIFGIDIQSYSELIFLAKEKFKSDIQDSKPAALIISNATSIKKTDKVNKDDRKI